MADANSTPIIANGLAYDADKTDTGAWYSGYLVANLGSMNNGPGKWVVGSDGFTYPASRTIDRSGFRALGSQAVTLYSSADWTLAESYRHQGNDLYFENTATVTIDTTDYNDHTTGHTVTLEGYINAQGTAETPLIVSGCGKVVLDSVPANGHNNVVNGAIAVTDGATLQINKDVVVGGSGTILLAAGATLSLPANDDKTFSVRDIVPLTLPTEGTAAIRIDGARLNLGNYEIATVASGTNVTLDPTSTAVSGRRTSLKIENDKLVLSLSPAGTILFFR